MIKLIVSDVDGTLVPEGTNSLNPEIFTLIRRLKSQGIYFAVASGRHKCSIEKMFAPVKEDIFYITSNGAYTGTCHECLAVSGLPKEVCQKLFRAFKALGDFPYIAESIDTAYTACPDPEFTRILTEDYGYQMTQCTSTEGFGNDIIKFSLYHPENVLNFNGDLLKKWNEICKCSISGTHWIDFIPMDANKGSALARLQERLGITIQETIAFGDQANDIEMLKQAYFSHAMANAGCTVKNAARFTCDSAENNGVLKVLNNFFPNN
ncbi:MAG TPA: hydrolase [Lachnospiraceae bacterium]|nr:hydrolase [Lachnospiraceae bacterium]